MFELVAGAHARVDFTVVSATLDEEIRPLVRWRRVPLCRRPFVVKYLMFFVLAAFRYLRRDVDLVHSLGAIIPRRVDVMSVHFCHAAYRADTAGARLERGQPFLRRANIAAAFRLGLHTERLFTRRPWTRIATAVSAGGARELARFYPRLPVVVVPNGVDHGRFRPDPVTREQVRLELDVADAEVVALFVGGRWSQKGLEIAIRGLARAQHSGQEGLTLWVAGAGDSRHYQAIADSLQVGDRVHFLGYVEQTERLYQAADIFVLPSAYETFCMVAYEAASSGLPIVATAVNGVDDLLRDGTAGILVEPDEVAVSEALATLAADPALRERMGAAGRSLVRDLTWASTAQSTVQLYERLLTQPDAGFCVRGDRS